MPDIVIAPDILAGCTAAASRALPKEACALLTGSPPAGGIWYIERLVVAANVAAEPLTGFEVDPALHLHLQRTCRAQAKAILGVWHSHPNGRPGPSPRDAAAAPGGPRLWLISAWNTDQWIHSAWFWSDGQGFTRLALEPGSEN